MPKTLKHEHDVLKMPIFKEFMDEDIASILAGVSEFFEQGCRMIFVLSETVHLEVNIKLPGITSYATLCMDP